jgi:hypothetical protein
MKQTLEESLKMKMVNFEVPKFNVNAPKPIMPATKKAVPKVEKQMRNVGNFTEELNRLHEQSTTLHRLMLEDTRVERNGMVDVVFGVYNSMVQSLGKFL